MDFSHRDTSSFAGSVHKQSSFKILDFSEWKKRNKEASGIEKNCVLSFPELLAREHVQESSCEQVFSKRIQEWIEHVKEKGVNPRDLETVELLFQLSQNAKNMGDLFRRIYKVQPFESFEAFCSVFCSGLTDEQRECVRKQIDWFLERVIQPQRIIKGDPESEDPYRFRLSTYFPEGVWMLLPRQEFYDSYDTYVEQGVLEEASELLKNGYTSPDYTHATGSIALSDLAKQKAILSAGELQRQNHTIKTGEQYSMLKTADGLESVYVDPGGPRYGYHVMNWFDEYPVTFGINAKQQAKFLQSIGFHYPNGSFFLDLHTDGEQIIGPKVPFSSIETIYVWKKYESQIRDWIKQYIPEVRLISLEAEHLLSELESKSGYRSLIESFAEKQGLSFEEGAVLFLKEIIQANQSS
jgi:hypothetical protein